MRPAGPDDAGEDGGAAQGGERGHAFSQQDHGEDEGEHRIEIDVVGGRDVPQLVHDQVPDKIAHQRGQDAQEQQVSPDHGLAKHGGGEGVLAAAQEGKDGDQAVKENFPCGGQGAVLPGHLPHEQAVDSPEYGGRDGQQVSPDRQLQPRPVKDDERHAGECQDGAANEGPAQADVLQAIGKPAPAEALVDQGENGREQRRRAHQEGGVAGLRIGQGGVLGQEVDGSAGYAHENEHEFLFPSVPEAYASSSEGDIQPDSGIGHHEARQEYGHRLHPRPDEHLGTHERYPPDSNHCQGQKVIGETGTVHNGRKDTCFLQ